jgi:hypothetical protein
VTSAGYTKIEEIALRIAQIRSLSVLVLLFGSSVLNAADNVVIGEVEMPEVASSPAFEQMKKKLGKWEGTLTQSLTGSSYNVSYEWKLVSGGNTIIETAIEDGVEMVTTYTDEDGELLVKHYCALGTEPVFSVVEASDGVVALAFDENRSPLRPHTHDYVDSMKWTMVQGDADSMVYEYVATLSGERSSNRAELKRN